MLREANCNYQYSIQNEDRSFVTRVGYVDGSGIHAVVNGACKEYTVIDLADLVRIFPQQDQFPQLLGRTLGVQ
jgi:hypothetical protein